MKDTDSKSQNKLPGMAIKQIIRRHYNFGEEGKVTNEKQRDEKDSMSIKMDNTLDKLKIKVFRVRSVQ